MLGERDEFRYFDTILGRNGNIKTLSNGKTIITFGNNDEVVYTVKNIIYDTDGNLQYELERSELGDEIIKLYLENPTCCIHDACCVASFKRFETAFNKLYGSLVQYLKSIKYFRNLRTVWYKFRIIWCIGVEQFEIYDVAGSYASKGAVGAVTSAKIGKSLDTEQIFLGMLKPGAVVQYWNNIEDYEKLVSEKWYDFINSPSGHSFVFLGYTYNSKGEIVGMYQWLYSEAGFCQVNTEAAVYWGTNYEN